MSNKTRSIGKKIISCILASVMAVLAMPSVFAVQSTVYVDPADIWQESSGRTNELDVNATVTYETMHCDVCGMDTTAMVYRVPEYTKSGETALNHGVFYSDGASLDGSTYGNVDNGLPGVDAAYTGYHYTKSVCQNCGTINAANGPYDYSFGRNVYCLYPCDHAFFEDFDDISYEMSDETYHYEIKKSGKYCLFCKGTYAKAIRTKDRHLMTYTVTAEPGNNRFVVNNQCAYCEYGEKTYLGAKSVVSAYIGEADGEAHTIRVNDLSDSAVKTRIRYGTEADECTLSSAPNYTKAGYYPIYYRITYTCDGEDITENGVSYVFLTEEDSPEAQFQVEVPKAEHEHHYEYEETVLPTCRTLGYDIFRCECGRSDKRNYRPATEHTFKDAEVTPASCTANGMIIHACTSCGEFYTETVPMIPHDYEKLIVPASCTAPGCTKHICKMCGESYMTDITPCVPHSFERIVREPSCHDMGYTVNTCRECGYSSVTDYTPAIGHQWDDGTRVSAASCTADGTVLYRCEKCGESKVTAVSASGHKPGKEADCTHPMTCLDCGAVLEDAKGHKYRKETVQPTCTSHGFTVYTCEICGDHYTSDITEPTPHLYEKAVTSASCTSFGYTDYTCVNCGKTYRDDYTDKLPHTYEKTVHPATCSEMGYTAYRCMGCGEAFTGDYTDRLPHSFITVVTAPTCTSFGYTTYMCRRCDEQYTDDYTDKLPHDYAAEIHQPTCTALGYTTYTCRDCGDSITGDYTAVLPHRYEALVDDPSCTESGKTTYVCLDCGDTVVGDYTDKLTHEYEAVVTAPTCTSFGYTTYTCRDCGEQYVADYTDKIPHAFDKTLTEPTCTALGFTSYSCPDCGFSYEADYTPPYGHDASDWIIDEEATVGHAGKKHIECVRCLEVLAETDIARLIAEDRTDEDGKSAVGTFFVLLTDKDGKPVFDSRIAADADGKLTVELPDGRLLDRADPTTVTVLDISGDKPASALTVLIYDVNGNAAVGKTNDNGQIIFPNAQTSTGTENGTVGSETDEESATYVVRVYDKTRTLIPACGVLLDENGIIVLSLPEGIRPTVDEPIIVTVYEPDGTPCFGITVTTAAGEEMLTVQTDTLGIAVLPVTNRGYTDRDGYISVDGYTVIVRNTSGGIVNAYVEHKADEGRICVTLPANVYAAYDSRVTVRITDKDGNVISDMLTHVNDARNAFSGKTDEAGDYIAPPIDEDETDKDGYAEICGMTIHVGNEKESIAGALVTLHDGELSVMLPQDYTLTTSNQTTVTVTDADGKALKGLSVTVSDQKGKTAVKTTNSSGKAVVPVKSSSGSSSRSVTASSPSSTVVSNTETHDAYIVGYPDGTFVPNGKMTRAEAAAVFARLTAKLKGESVSGKSSFSDVGKKAWYAPYVAYAEKYGIVKGVDDESFLPQISVTRAELVTMALRFYSLDHIVPAAAGGTNFTDVPTDHFAFASIANAVGLGWIHGYADGSFRPDAPVTRAEAVTIINRALGRNADMKYVLEHFGQLTHFTDVTDQTYWAFGDIMEAANLHKAVTDHQTETWQK